jgi:hypothetical protein
MTFYKISNTVVCITMSCTIQNTFEIFYKKLYYNPFIILIIYYLLAKLQITPSKFG